MVAEFFWHQSPWAHQFIQDPGTTLNIQYRQSLQMPRWIALTWEWAIKVAAASPNKHSRPPVHKFRCSTCRGCLEAVAPPFRSGNVCPSKPEQTTARGALICLSPLSLSLPIGSHIILKVTGENPKAHRDGLLRVTGRARTSGLCFPQPFSSHEGCVSGVSNTPAMPLPPDPSRPWACTPQPYLQEPFTRCSPPSSALPCEIPWMSLPCGTRKPYFYSACVRSEFALHSQFKFRVCLSQRQCFQRNVGCLLIWGMQFINIMMSVEWSRWQSFSGLKAACNTVLHRVPQSYWLSQALHLRLEINSHRQCRCGVRTPCVHERGWSSTSCPVLLGR